MPAGKYVLPFKFSVPSISGLPPSFKKRPFGSIQYFVESRICPPGIGTIETKKALLTVIPRVDVNQPQYNQPAIVSGSKDVSFLLQKGGTVNASMEIPRRAWAPGDKFKAGITIINNSGKTLAGYATGLREHVVYYSDVDRKRATSEKNDVLIESFPEPIPPMTTLSRKIGITIPSGVGPSFDPDVGRVIQRMYYIIFVVRLPGINFDLPVYAPILIGTVPYNESLQCPSPEAPSAPPPLSTENSPSAPPPLSTENSLSSPPLPPPVSDCASGNVNEPSAPLKSSEPVKDYQAVLHAQMNNPKSVGMSEKGNGNTNANGASENGSNDNNSTIVPPPPASSSSSVVTDGNRAASSFGFSMVGNENDDDNE